MARWCRYERVSNGHALLAFDVDNFEDLNATYGRELGDAVLDVFIQRTTALLERWHTTRPGTSSTLVRIGGDEFIIKLHDLGSEPLVEARSIAEAIVEKFAEPIAAGQATIRTSVSGGAVATSGDPGLQVLLDEADRLLHEAKKAGRNCARVVAV